MIEQLFMIAFALMKLLIPLAITVFIGWIVYTFVLTYHRTHSLVKAFVAILP